MKKRALATSLLICLIIAVLALSGCSKTPNVKSPADQNISPQNPASANNLSTIKLKLYFADDQAMYLIPESREIKIQKDNETDTAIAEAIVNELIAGPTDKNLIATMPKGTKLLSLKITDQIAIVDFSQEMKSNHSGGSTGEELTLNSLVDSLTELKGVKKVQILINGEKIDTLAGHMDTSLPISRDESILKK